MSENNENLVNTVGTQGEPPAEDVMGIVTILDAEDSADSDMLARFSRSSAIIREPDGREYITLKAAESYTGYSNQTLRQYYKKGKIKGIKKETSFGDTIYLELEGVKTFKAAVSTKKAAKMDSAEFAMEVSGLLSSTAGEAILPVMEKVSAIELGQIEILEKLSAVEELSETVMRLSEAVSAFSGENDPRFEELSRSVEQIKEHLGISGAEISADESGDGAGESAEEADGAQVPIENEEPVSEVPEKTEEIPEKPPEQSISPDELKQLMEDYREMKETIKSQREYIEKQRSRGFFDRLFNREPKD